MTDKSAIEKMKEWAEHDLESVCRTPEGHKVMGEVLDKARRLLEEEQAQKPPADMAGLVVILKSFVDMKHFFLFTFYSL